MKEHHHAETSLPFSGRPFSEKTQPAAVWPQGLLGGLLVGGLGYLLGRQQGQSRSQQRQPHANAQSGQLAQLSLLGQLRESGVLTEEEFQEQKQKILHQS